MYISTIINNIYNFITDKSIIITIIIVILLYLFIFFVLGNSSNIEPSSSIFDTTSNNDEYYINLEQFRVNAEAKKAALQTMILELESFNE